MARLSPFLTETTLYHPTEGAKTFPAGEQDPGPAWFDTKACTDAESDDPVVLRAEIVRLNAELAKFDGDGNGKAGGSKGRAAKKSA